MQKVEHQIGDCVPNCVSDIPATDDRACPCWFNSDVRPNDTAHHQLHFFYRQYFVYLLHNKRSFKSVVAFFRFRSLYALTLILLHCFAIFFAFCTYICRRFKIMTEIFDGIENQNILEFFP